MSDSKFPNETADYRSARNALLDAEIELRAHVAQVAKMRGQLPPGGRLNEDFVFEELVDGKTAQRKFSELFGGKDTLFVYSFMYGPTMDGACPSCTSFIDALDGQLVSLNERIATAIIAKHDIATLSKFAKSRGWRNVRFLSSGNNNFNQDYLAEIDGSQMPLAHIFVRDGDKIRHSWTSEMLYAKNADDQDPRHVDMMWPLWNVLDLTPEGRGDYYPSLNGRT